MAKLAEKTIYPVLEPADLDRIKPDERTQYLCNIPKMGWVTGRFYKTQEFGILFKPQLVFMSDAWPIKHVQKSHWQIFRIVE